MAKDYDNTNRGVLFKNNRKETDTHPDLTGHININGKEYWLSAWKNESREGEAFYSLSLGKEREQREKKDNTPEVPFNE